MRSIWTTGSTHRFAPDADWALTPIRIRMLPAMLGRRLAAFSSIKKSIMKPRLLFSLLVLTAVCLQGCGDSSTSPLNTNPASNGEMGQADVESKPGHDNHEIVLSDMTALMNEISAIVEPVSDEASANSAAAEVEKLIAKGQSITARLEALEEPKGEELKRLEEVTKDELEALIQKIDDANRKGAKYPELRKALNRAIPVF